MNVEAVGKCDGSAVADVAGDVGLVDFGLQFVRRRHHDQVCPLGSFSDRENGEAIGLDLGSGCRTRLQRDADFLGAGILQVQRVGAALAAVADNGDLLGLDEVDVGITIVIDAHLNGPSR
ncbi:hypothetical protein D3C87_1731580 [compost metagenome]